jgi:uncharacterized zinc-type alcohol dehydrogenase-like protein
LSKALAYAATSRTSPMAPITIFHREPRSNDVNIEILYCGVCHTDIHTAHGEWDGLIYPNGTLCAGITMWSPLRHWKTGPGSKVGIVGIGGLGHMGVKLARALGAHVVAFTTSESKRADALRLGAQEVVVSRNPEEMNAQAGKLDFILNTVAVAHSLDTYLALLRHGGTMALVGIPGNPHPSPSVASLMGLRRSLAGSLVGGIKETQEMLDFCAENGVVAETETIPMQEIETAFARMVKNDVKYRFVVDMRSLKRSV